MGARSEQRSSAKNAYKAAQRFVKENKDRRVAKLGANPSTLHLFDDVIVFERATSPLGATPMSQIQPIAGATARVVADTQFRDVSGNTAYCIRITGPGWEIVTPPAVWGLAVRNREQFCTKVNALGAAAHAGYIETDTTPVSAPTTIADELLKLADLHADGVLSAEEYASLKARVIA